MLKVFGKAPAASEMSKSPHYKNGGFHNLEHTVMMAPDANYFKIMKGFFGKGVDKEPARPFQLKKTDLKTLPADKNSLVWMGHSAYYLDLRGYKVLVDPVLSGHASPFSFSVKAFKGADLYGAADFPEIDVLLITHDHYDHLDYQFVTSIKNKVKKVVCSLGVASHLQYWGYDGSIISELDWWQSLDLGGSVFTAVPARHFSGRLFKRNQGLWSGFVLKRERLNILLGGDSGYGQHFTEIGRKYGPFDLAILECGQYNTMWPNIHMLPEETVKAAKDLMAKVLLPVHWGKFSLALHSWYDPPVRVVQAAREQQQALAMPAIGENYEIGTTTTGEWWNKYR